MKRAVNIRNRALTLIEVMVSVSLLGVLLLTVGPTLRRTSASTHGAAISLAAVLTEVRQQAIARQEPVALVIPGGSGQADSYYILAGDQPRVTKVQRLGSEQPGARLMVGHWPLDAGQLRDPSLTTTITPPPETSRDLSFSLDAWGLPQSNDYAFVFTPSGKLLTNDLPNFDGAYHIVVSHGGLTSPSGAPGTGAMSSPPSLFQLSEVGTPYTIVLQPSGLVSVVPGLIANASVAVKEQAAIAAAPNPPSIDPQPSTPPVVTGVSLLPDPAKLNLPAGVQVLIAPDRHLTLTVRATSPERAPLFCQWTAAGGGLSSDRPVRMTYHQDTGEWESVWQWHPPAGATAGQQFQLEGIVSDGFGNQVAALVGTAPGASPVAQVGDASAKMAFGSDLGGEYSFYAMNQDGTGVTRLTRPDPPVIDLMDIQWSPDGQRTGFIEYTNPVDVFHVYADGEGRSTLTDSLVTSDLLNYTLGATKIALARFPVPAPNENRREIFVMNLDGSGSVNVTNSPTIDERVSASPDGSRLLVVADDATNFELQVTNADGSGPVPIDSHSGATEGIVISNDGTSWSPNGLQVVYLKKDGASPVYTDIFVANADGTGTPTNLTNGPAIHSVPKWSPDGGKLLFTTGTFNNEEIIVMNADGTGRAQLTNNSPVVWDGQANWTPDGGKIMFTTDRDGDAEIYLMNSDGSNPVNLTRSPTSNETVSRPR